MAGFSSERCQVAKYSITHLYTIEDVKSQFALKNNISSSPFFCPDEPRPVQFKLDISFGKKKKEWLSCYVRPKDEEIFLTGLTVEVKDVDSKTLCTKTDSTRQVIGGGTNAKFASWGFTHLYNLTACSEEILRIKCNISYHGSSVNKDYVTIAQRDPNLTSNQQPFVARDATEECPSRHFHRWRPET